MSHFSGANRRLPLVYSVLPFLRTTPSPTERCISFPRHRHPQLHSTSVIEAAVARGEEGEEEAEVRSRAGITVRHGSKSRPRLNPATPTGSPSAVCAQAKVKLDTATDAARIQSPARPEIQPVDLLLCLNLNPTACIVGQDRTPGSSRPRER